MKYIVNPVTGEYESTAYTFRDRFALGGGVIHGDKVGDRENFAAPLLIPTIPAIAKFLGLGAAATGVAIKNYLDNNPEMISAVEKKFGDIFKSDVTETGEGLVISPDATQIEKQKKEIRDLTKPIGFPADYSYIPFNKGRDIPEQKKPDAPISRPPEIKPLEGLPDQSGEIDTSILYNTRVKEIKKVKKLFDDRRDKEGREDYSIVNKKNNKKFVKKFQKFIDKYYGGRILPGAKAIGVPRVTVQAAARDAEIKLIGRPSGSEKIIAPVENGIKLGELTTKLKNDSQFRESFIEEHKNNDSYLDAKNIGNLLGVDTSKKRNVNYITEKLGTGKFQSLGVKTKKNEFGHKTFNVKDAVEKLVKNSLIKPSKGGSGRAQSFRYEDEKFSDKIGFNLNKSIIRQVNNFIDSEQGRLPNRRQKVDLAESGHSIDISFKKQFPKLFKDAMNINNLVSQEADINKKVLRSFQKKYKGVFKELEPLVGKKVTPKIKETLLNNKLKMDNLNKDILIKIKEKIKENPDLYRDSDKRRADIILNIPEVGEKFKPTDIEVDMSKVDKRYIIGNIDTINPDAKKVSDLSEEEFKTYAQNIINQKADEVNVKYTLAEYDPDLIDDLVESVETYEYEPIPKQNKNMGGMIEVMDETMMMAQGGRVNFDEGSPDPDFLNAISAARDNDNIPIEDKTFLGIKLADNPLEKFNQMIDPRAYPYYGQKIVEGASRIPEYALRTVPALGQTAGDLIKGRKTGKMDRFVEAITPTVTNKAQEAIGLTKLIKDTEKNRTGAQEQMGGQLEFLAEVPGPATPLFLLKTPKYVRQLRGLAGSTQAAKELENKIQEKIAVDQGRRDFNILLGTGGVMAVVKALGLDKLIPVGSKVVQKTAPIVTPGGTPKYFFDFVNLIKKSGDDITEKAATLERQKVYDYNGYTMYEDITTGEIRIEKSIEGMASGTDEFGEVQRYETLLGQEEIIYRPGEMIKGKAGKPTKTLDEYEEATAKPDSYGDMDSDSGLDSIEEILNLLRKDGKKYSKTELEDMGIDPDALGNYPTGAGSVRKETLLNPDVDTFTGKPKKAGGGIMKLAGDDSGPPPTSGPNSQGLALILKRAKQY